MFEAIKLVDPKNVAGIEEIAEGVDRAIDQGTQGWGASRSDRIILGLAKQVYDLSALASKSDELQRALKGEQMAHGRTRAKLQRALEGSE